MKFTKFFDAILGNKSKVSILRFLIESDTEQAGREIARNTGLAQRIAHQALADLRQNGIVKMRRAGRAKLYKINKDNVSVKKALFPLFSFEANLLKNIGEKIHAKLRGKALSIVLFGSVAAGRERGDSDIDILIVLKETANLENIENILDALSHEFSKEYGNLLSPVTIKEKAFKKKYLKGDKFMRNIINTGIIIHGKYFMELIHA